MDAPAHEHVSASSAAYAAYAASALALARRKSTARCAVGGGDECCADALSTAQPTRISIMLEKFRIMLEKQNNDEADHGLSAPGSWLIISVLGVTQILAWGASFYLLAVLAKPISIDTGWPIEWVVGGLSLGLLVAGAVSPRVGDSIHKLGGRPVLAASCVCLAVGLAGLALAPNLSAYIVACSWPASAWAPGFMMRLLRPSAAFSVGAPTRASPP
jgi:hypothetical protein